MWSLVGGLDFSHMLQRNNNNLRAYKRCNNIYTLKIFDSQISRTIFIRVYYKENVSLKGLKGNPENLSMREVKNSPSERVMIKHRTSFIYNLALLEKNLNKDV